MNTLLELNTYGLTPVTYTDSRPAGLLFDRINPTNGTVSVNQHDIHNVPVGINIEEMIRPQDANISYTIDVSASPGASVTWDTIPDGCTYSNPSLGVYKVSGLTVLSHWNTLKSPTINLDISYLGNFTYTATIGWNTSDTKSWTVATSVADITNMSVPEDFYFSAGHTGLVTGNPIVIDNISTTWTVTVTPSLSTKITTLSSAGTGGTSEFNNTSKVLTIVGTKTQVNSHLNSITYVAPSTSKQDITFTYGAVNNTNDEGDAKVQQWYNTEYLSATRANSTYYFETESSITNGPLITDINYTGYDDYTMTVQASPSSSVASMSSTGHYGWPIAQVIDNPDGDLNDGFGDVHALNADGSYLVIGSPADDYNGSSIQGSVAIYYRSGSTYVKQQVLAPTDPNDGSWGSRVSISDDGLTLSFSGSYSETSGTNTGAYYIYVRSGDVWTQQAKLVPTNTANNSLLTYHKLSGNGNTLLTLNSYTGKFTIFTRSGTTWTQKTQDTAPYYITGTSGVSACDISYDGNTIVIADGGALGIGTPARVSDITVNTYGNTATSTTQKKFGTHSIHFDGYWTGYPSTNEATTGSYMTLKDNSGNFPLTQSSEFTFECWAYRTGTAGIETIVDFNCPAVGNTSQANNHSSILPKVQFVPNITTSALTGSSTTFTAGILLSLKTGSGATYIHYPTTAINQWMHIAVTRASDGTYKLYVDGVSAGSVSYPTTYASSQRIRLGAMTSTTLEGTYQTLEYFFTGYIDEIRFTNSIVYTTTFTPTTNELDNYPDTLVLLHANGSFVDDTSANYNHGYNIPNSGVVTVYTRTSPTGNWAVQQNIRPESILAEQFGTYFVGLTSDGNSLMVVAQQSHTTYYYTRAYSYWTKQSELPYQVKAFSKDGTVILNPVNNSGSSNTQNIYYKNGSAWDFIGRHEDTNGDSWDISISNDGQYICTSNPAYDPGTGRTPRGIDLRNGALISTLRSKIGDSSIALDGTNDYIFVSQGENLTNFTLEAWIYATSLPSSGTTPLFTFGNTKFYIGHDGSGSQIFGASVNNGANLLVENTTIISTGVWYHIAFVRSGSTVKVYQGGSEITTGSWATAIDWSTTEVLIGNSDSTYFGGNLEEVRISKSVRYPSSFTPSSTTAFTNDSNTLLLLHGQGYDGQTDITDDSGAGMYTGVVTISKKAITGSVWDAETKTLTLTGMKSVVNADIDTIKMTPAPGVTSDITLTYSVTTPEDNTDSRTQTITHTT